MNRAREVPIAEGATVQSKGATTLLSLLSGGSTVLNLVQKVRRCSLDRLAYCTHKFMFVTAGLFRAAPRHEARRSGKAEFVFAMSASKDPVMIYRLCY
jgi:hypothetical protein